MKLVKPYHVRPLVQWIDHKQFSDRSILTISRYLLDAQHRPSQDKLAFDPSKLSRQPSSSSPITTVNQTIKSIQLDPNDDDAEDDLLESIVVVFFADGTARYNDMTAYALRTFIDSTPRIMVGLLAKNQQTINDIVNTLAKSQRHRVIPKIISSTPHFDDWHPTQYKLDIQQYADAFETIFWFDSDTITFGDMTEFLASFAGSTADFYLTPDHVNGNKGFCERWAKHFGSSCVIPQACLMGFKTTVIVEFFEIWKAIWMHWITPKPFANDPDPNPKFEGSAFCTEQYALGQALVLKDDWIGSVLWFRRSFIAVPKGTDNAAPIDQLPSRINSFTPLANLIASNKNAMVDISELRSIQVPPKSITKRLSNSIVASEHYDYIDRFANMYHCYNHSYDRVKKWYQMFLAYGVTPNQPSPSASSSSVSSPKSKNR